MSELQAPGLVEESPLEKEFTRFIEKVDEMRIQRSSYQIPETNLKLGQQGYFNELVSIWQTLGLPDLKDLTIEATPSEKGDMNKFDPFPERIHRSIAYSLQYPKPLDLNGVFNPRYSLERFIDAYIGEKRLKSHPPFTMFCIAYANVDSIPNHFGHSAFKENIARKPTEGEKKADKTYRRCLAKYAGVKIPVKEGEMLNVPRQDAGNCAEFISIPYLLTFARRYLDGGEAGEPRREITISCMAMTAVKVARPMCIICRTWVSDTVNAPEWAGLKIIDLVSEEEKDPNGLVNRQC